MRIRCSPVKKPQLIQLNNNNIIIYNNKHRYEDHDDYYDDLQLATVSCRRLQSQNVTRRYTHLVAATIDGGLLEIKLACDI